MGYDIKRSERRTYRYWFVDGISELFMGAFLLLLAVWFYSLPLLPQNPLVTLGFFALIFGLGFLARQAINRIKEHQTYPRTGYVEYHSGWQNKRAVAVSAGFALLLLGLNFYVILTRQAGNPNWLLTLTGAIFAFIFGSIAFRTGEPRHFALMMFSLLASAGMAFTGLAGWQAVAGQSAAIGLLALILGSLTRRTYLRHNPQPQDADER